MKSLSLSVFLAILILFLLFGCGTRKIGKEYHEISSNYSFNDKSYILTQNVHLNDIYELVPIDNSKPFIVDGKEYFNVSIKFDKSKFDNFEIDKRNIKTSTGKSEINETKQTTKNNNWIFIVLIVCGFVFLWLWLPKIKTGI